MFQGYVWNPKGFFEGVFVFHGEVYIGEVFKQPETMTVGSN